MNFKEWILENWEIGFPYEVQATKNKQVVSSKIIRNRHELEQSQEWFNQYKQQGCNFEKQLLFSTYEAVDIPGTVYLIHFKTPYFHAKHYLGWTTNVDKRINVHKKGLGSRLLQVIKGEGIDWKVSRLWQNVTRRFERHLKEVRKNAPQLCPICRGEISYDALVTPETD